MREATEARALDTVARLLLKRTTKEIKGDKCPTRRLCGGISANVLPMQKVCGAITETARISDPFALSSTLALSFCTMSWRARQSSMGACSNCTPAPYSLESCSRAAEHQSSCLVERLKPSGRHTEKKPGVRPYSVRLTDQWMRESEHARCIPHSSHV